VLTRGSERKKNREPKDNKTEKERKSNREMKDNKTDLKKTCLSNAVKP
jgi:hypothetical protein